MCLCVHVCNMDVCMCDVYCMCAHVMCVFVCACVKYVFVFVGDVSCVHVYFYVHDMCMHAILFVLCVQNAYDMG